MPGNVPSTTKREQAILALMRDGPKGEYCGAPVRAGVESVSRRSGNRKRLLLRVSPCGAALPLQSSWFVIPVRYREYEGLNLP